MTRIPVFQSDSLLVLPKSRPTRETHANPGYLLLATLNPLLAMTLRKSKHLRTFFGQLKFYLLIYKAKKEFILFCMVT